VRSLALKDLAYQTYLGLQDFFIKNNNITVTSSYNPALLYAWNTPVIGSNSDPKDIYALQTALIMDGDFPPKGENKNACPHSGILGPCTKAAVQEFQKKNNISNESIFGSKTFGMLNAIYTENKN
jgi:peptidoglycan hydrolase-like protein with peptidoglycan-binding domain